MYAAWSANNAINIKCHKKSTEIQRFPEAMQMQHGDWAKQPHSFGCDEEPLWREIFHCAGENCISSIEAVACAGWICCTQFSPNNLLILINGTVHEYVSSLIILPSNDARRRYQHIPTITIRTAKNRAANGHACARIVETFQGNSEICQNAWQFGVRCSRRSYDLSRCICPQKPCFKFCGRTGNIRKSW